MKKTRPIALLLTLMFLLAMLAGCGGDDSTQSPSVSPSPSGGSVTNDNPDGDPAISLPFTEDVVSLSYWQPVQPFMMAKEFEPEEMLFFSEMENRTNIHMELTLISFLQVREQFSVLMASQDYPNLINNFLTYYGDGGAVAIEQDIIIDLMPYISNELKDYKAALDTNEEFWLRSLTLEGQLPTANHLFTQAEPTTAGLLIRSDWLDDFGMSVPETYDEVEGYLTAAKNETGRGTFLLGNAGNDTEFSFSGGFGAQGYGSTTNVDTHPFLNVNGEVVYSPITEEYKNYLRLMNKWWDAGLIHPDYASLVQNQLVEEVIAGKGSIWSTSYEQGDVVHDTSEGQVTLAAMKMPTVNKGDMVHVARSQVIMHLGVAVTTANSEEELALILKWLDYCYTDDGRFLGSYGTEGVSFDYDEDSEPYFTDLVMNNEHYPVIGGIYLYTTYGGAGFVDGNRYVSQLPESQRNILELWPENIDRAWMIPTGYIKFAVDDQTVFTSIMSEVSTYTLESTNRFIMGDLDIDKDWDNYVSIIKGFDIDTAIDIMADGVAAHESKAQFIPD